MRENELKYLIIGYALCIADSIIEEINTQGMTEKDLSTLRFRVLRMIIEQGDKKNVQE